LPGSPSLSHTIERLSGHQPQKDKGRKADTETAIEDPPFRVELSRVESGFVPHPMGGEICQPGECPAWQRARLDRVRARFKRRTGIRGFALPALARFIKHFFFANGFSSP
jgi:hypothetical protein